MDINSQEIVVTIVRACRKDRGWVGDKVFMQVVCLPWHPQDNEVVLSVGEVSGRKRRWPEQSVRMPIRRGKNSTS